MTDSFIIFLSFIIWLHLSKLSSKSHHQKINPTQRKLSFPHSSVQNIISILISTSTLCIEKSFQMHKRISFSSYFICGFCYVLFAQQIWYSEFCSLLFFPCHPFKNFYRYADLFHSIVDLSLYKGWAKKKRNLSNNWREPF